MLCLTRVRWSHFLNICHEAACSPNLYGGPHVLSIHRAKCAGQSSGRRHKPGPQPDLAGKAGPTISQTYAGACSIASCHVTLLFTSLRRYHGTLWRTVHICLATWRMLGYMSHLLGRQVPVWGQPMDSATPDLWWQAFLEEMTYTWRPQE